MLPVLHADAAGIDVGAEQLFVGFYGENRSPNNQHVL
jgi:hypothetical protein